LELSYFVTSGAAIIENGKETITVKADDDVSAEYVGDAEIIRFDGNVSKEGEKKPVLAKKVISVNRPLNEEARVAGKIKLLVSRKNVILSENDKLVRIYEASFHKFLTMTSLI